MKCGKVSLRRKRAVIERCQMRVEPRMNVRYRG